MVGSRRLELPTSSVSRKRSNQLSYEPTTGGNFQYTNRPVIATIVPDELPSSPGTCRFQVRLWCAPNPT